MNHHIVITIDVFFVFSGVCHVKLASTPKNLLGADAPECNADGTFKTKQCHSSSGYCWCVDPATGSEIQGTKKGPSEEEVECRKSLRLCAFGSSPS